MMSFSITEAAIKKADELLDKLNRDYKEYGYVYSEDLEKARDAVECMMDEEGYDAMMQDIMFFSTKLRKEK